eukprot:5272249-Pyramimonas_sp.AAC.1
MIATPYPWAQLHTLHGITMCAARRSCGLSRHASTGLMMANRRDFGVGVDSAYHTYCTVMTEGMKETLNHPGDIGRMTRGLWQYHRRHLAKGGLDYLRESTVA